MDGMSYLKSDKMAVEQRLQSVHYCSDDMQYQLLSIVTLLVFEGRACACSLLNYIYRFIQSRELGLCVALICDCEVDGRHKSVCGLCNPSLFFKYLISACSVVPVGNC